MQNNYTTDNSIRLITAAEARFEPFNCMRKVGCSNLDRYRTNSFKQVVTAQLLNTQL